MPNITLPHVFAFCVYMQLIGKGYLYLYPNKSVFLKWNIFLPVGHNSDIEN